MSTSIAAPASPLSTSFVRDPAVIDWHIALAPVPRPARVHWWRELVTSTHRDARDAWLKLRESELCLQMEDDEFRAAYPPPTLRDTMIALATGGMPAPGWGVGI